MPQWEMTIDADMNPLECSAPKVGQHRFVWECAMLIEAHKEPNQGIIPCVTKKSMKGTYGKVQISPLYQRTIDAHSIPLETKPKATFMLLQKVSKEQIIDSRTS